MRLLDEIDDALGDSPQRIGASTGASRGAVDSAVEAVVPVVIGAMADRAEASDGPNRLRLLLDELGRGSAAAVENGGVALSAGPDLGGDGAAGRFVAQLLGADRDDVVTGLSSSAGLREPLVEQTLVVVAPVVAAVVDRHRNDDELDADGLTEFLLAERADLVAGGRLHTVDAMLEAGAVRAAGTLAPILIADRAPASTDRPAPGSGDDVSVGDDLSVGDEAIGPDVEDSVAGAVESDDAGGGRAGWLWWAVTAAIVIALSLLLATCGGSGDDAPSTSAPTSSDTPTSTPTSPSTTAVSTTAPSTTVVSTTTPSTTPTTERTTTDPDPEADLAAAVGAVLIGQAGVSAEIDGGTVTLEGTVADEDEGVALTERIATLPGVELVVNRLVVEPPSDTDDDSSADTLNERLDLDPVTFAYLSTVITPEGEQVLDRAARYLIDNPTLRIEIGGHTDSDGPADDNQRLSELRASEVRAFLVARGIAADRLEVKGYGETEPTVPNDTPENKAINRRIEFTIL